MPFEKPALWQELALTQRMPACARRVLAVAPDVDPLASALRAQKREVQAAAEAATLLNGAPDVEGRLFDAVALDAGACGKLRLSTVLALLEPQLDARGGFFVWGRREKMLTELALTPFIVYAHWAENAEGSLCLAVRQDYNPLEHARELFRAGHAGLSYDLLNRIPETYLSDGETAAVVAVEKQLCLLAWDNAGEGDSRLVRFYNSLFHFYAATAAAPEFAEAYHCQAEFWHRIGDDGMARRLLGTIQRVRPSDAAERQKQRFTDPLPSPPHDEPPEWIPGARPPRVLLITHDVPDYGLDVLYDGLCAVLGADNVVEYPYKPSLHGVTPDQLAHYPCLFDLPGDAVAFEDLLAQLRAGAFDLVLYGDTDRRLAPEQARAVVEAAGATPMALIDAGDSCQDSRVFLRDHFDPAALFAVFKRECLTCVDYGPDVFPLPFAYPESRIPERMPEERNRMLFWAGHRLSGLRRLYLEQIATTFGLTFADRVEQEAYAATLLDARIGLNFFGFGFDTVRYWELPAHGCMLFSEKLPIRVPHNFTDGESAVFFTTLGDLEERLRLYLNRHEKVAEIGVNGREHLLRFHTGSARARQLLGWAEQALGRKLAP